MKGRMNIGTTSLILIFIVLCLTTFGLLSLTSAKGDLNLARKGAASVQTYYRADCEGEEFLAQADQKLGEVFEAAGAGADREALLEEKLKSYYRSDSGTIQTDIPMDYGQVLHIELGITDGGDRRYEILTWKVYNQDEYEIDDSMPVWTGDMN